ncbi:hypothetical protein N9C60_05565 [Flavobacteriaceae bacterium]|nr:hypothetical protein [Flavobacteriaceae bacterium]MDC0386628.1 hypothetical protein [Flavobacteriaceae bacterium]
MTKKLPHKAFEKWAVALKAPPLPESHQDLFLKRLAHTKRQRRLVLQWAAVALLFLSLGSGIFFTQPQPEPEIEQFLRAETYLTQIIQEHVVQIEKINVSGSKKLVENSKLKLAKLQNSYQELYQDWDLNQNQPLFINALILNLRTQLQLLEDIQEQLTLLQQKSYEKI